MSGDEMMSFVSKGWIKPCGLSGDVQGWKRELEQIGVKVGAWDLFDQEFQGCTVSPNAMDRLDPLWGRYIWGLGSSLQAEDDRKVTTGGKSRCSFRLN